MQDYLDPMRRYLARKDYASPSAPLPKPRPDDALIRAWLALLAQISST